jgi:hypothetical protein
MFPPDSIDPNIIHPVTLQYFKMNILPLEATNQLIMADRRISWHEANEFRLKTSAYGWEMHPPKENDEITGKLLSEFAAANHITYLAPNQNGIDDDIDDLGTRETGNHTLSPNIHGSASGVIDSSVRINVTPTCRSRLIL